MKGAAPEAGGPRPRLILASASPRRLDLLRQVGLVPDEVRPTECDETPQNNELPRDLARRLAGSKAGLAADLAPPGSFVLAADTVVAVGRRILPKALTDDEAGSCLDLLSGRAHRVYTAVSLRVVGGPERGRLVETRVRFKRLSGPERLHYLRSRDWHGKAGGYAIQGLAGAFVIDLVGSYSAVVGLPLYETVSLLDGLGFPVRPVRTPSENADHG